jgi:amino acid adenylation domain-containing protein
MLVKKFEEQVKITPHKLAVKTNKKSVTYDELNKSANRIANEIKTRLPGCLHDGRVGLLFEHGVDMIAALLGTLKEGKTYVPLSPDYPLKRLSYIISHSGTSLILTDFNNRISARELGDQNHIPVLNIEEIEDSIPCENHEREARADRLAYIMYTSGSTGTPKGVTQTQKNVLYFINRYSENLSITRDDRMTLFSSFNHDAAVMDIYGAFFSGATLYPWDIKKEADISAIARWLKIERITLWHSVPTVYRYFVTAMAGHEKFPLVRLAVLGGEEVLKNDIEMCRKLFPHAALCNLYGQTESSYNAAEFITPEMAVNEITLGETVEGTEIFVIDEKGNEVVALETGEIVVASPHVSPGYWKDEESDKNSFYQDPEYGRLYLTGDLGRLLLDGNIEFMGRKDYQVKIRGLRIELGEIESQLLKYGEIKETAVLMREDKRGDKYLCAYVVPYHPGNFQEPGAREYLLEVLPDYMIPSYFVEIEQIPLTPNGKVDRGALPFPELKVDSQHTAPRNLVEEKLAKIWSDLLPIDKDVIGIDGNFFQLGGHSLKAMALVSKIHNELDTRIPLAQVFKTPTIRGLSKFIKETAEDKNISIEVGEEKEYYKVTPDQKRMFILNGLDSVNTTYNIPRAWKIEGPFNIRLFDHALRALIQRHDSLRTSFALKDSEPVQIIKKEVEPRIEYINAEAGDFQHAKENENIIHQFIQPFDLGKAPLFRVGLIKVGQNEHVFICDMHHIISDGISVNILLFDFIRLYAKESLPRLRIQYKDFTMWKNRMLRSGEMKRQEEYWLDQFKGEPPLLNIPTDYPRQAARSFKGDRVSTGMDRTVTNKIKEIGLETETTLFMVLLAAFNILLSRYTEQEDIIVGTPISGRNHTDLDNIVGMFINTLGMRNQPEGHKSFKSFLKELKTNALKAYDNQYYPFEELANKLSIPRDKGRNPLFDVLFVSENIDIDIPGLTIKGLQFAPYQFEHGIAHLDLVLYFTEANDEIDLILEYSTALFKSKTARKILDHYIEILEQIAANRERNLNSIVLSHDFSIARSAVLQEEEVDFSF